MNRLSRWKDSLTWERIAIAILLVLGVVLRIRQYLAGRSLWVDEAMLALNIVNRGFAGMFMPLDYDQGAPIGFLLVEKIFAPDQIVLGGGISANFEEYGPLLKPVRTKLLPAFYRNQAGVIGAALFAASTTKQDHFLQGINQI